MPDLVKEFLESINISQLLAIGLMFWFFYSRLNTRMDKIESRFQVVQESLQANTNNSQKHLETKIDKLGEKIEDVDRRLCRIEGSLASSGHCLFAQKEEKKAE